MVLSLYTDSAQNMMVIDTLYPSQFHLQHVEKRATRAVISGEPEKKIILNLKLKVTFSVILS